jgi:hypothetical protein
MDVDRENKVADLKQRIRDGTYRVDPKAVAEAIVRRMVELSTVGARASAHSPSVVRPSR